MSTKLMLSSGKIFGSYALLEKYLELCPDEERVWSLPSSPDVEFVKYLASRGSATVERFIEELTERFVERVNPSYSVKAAKEVLGMELAGDQAVQLVAAQLAGWTLEIAEALGVIKLRKSP